MSRGSTSIDSMDPRLHGVYSYRETMHLIDEYLASIQVDDDNPAFLFGWDEDNANAFVEAANRLNPAQAPQCLRTRPPNMTAGSFVDNVVYRLQPLAGGRFHHIMLAPNNQQQFLAVATTLVALQNHKFLQNAAQTALPVVNNVERYLAVTAHLTDTKSHNAGLNSLEPTFQNDDPVRRLFI